MEPIRVQQPGSSDAYTVTQFDFRTAGSYYDLAEFLASRFTRYWPPVEVAGLVQSVDQQFAWRAECARVINGGGVILLTNHTSGNGRIIGVAIACMTGQPHEAELVVNGAAYDAETLEPIQLAELRQECARQGAVLGRAKMVRTWEAV